MTETAPAFTPDELAAPILADEPDTADAPLGAETWTTTVGQLIETQKGDTRVAGALRQILDGALVATITGSGGTGIIRFTRPTPTGDLDAKTVARYRKDGQSAYFHEARSLAGLPELVDCDGCEPGIVQRVVDDYADDTGPSYKAVGGCSIVIEQPHRLTDTGEQFAVRSHYCPVCTAARA